MTEPGAEPRIIEVFSRPGCHLCEKLLEELLPMVRGRFDVKVRNIDTRPDWQERYGTLIPVVRYAGRDICHYALDRQAIRSLADVEKNPNQAS